MSREINRDIEVLQARIMAIRRDLIEANIPITAKTVLEILNGRSLFQQKGMEECITCHNNMVFNQVGDKYAIATSKRYETTGNHIRNYILYKYKCKDILLSELNYDFILGFELYLKNVRKCSHNSSIKYVKNLKTIVNHARKNEWINKDPFAKYECKLEQIEREVLTSEEIQALRDKEITIERLEVIRDIFIFSCLTGLAHVDIKKLSMKDISQCKNHDVIVLDRTKTGVRCDILILPAAKKILDKYADHPCREVYDLAFPVPCNHITIEKCNRVRSDVNC